jgi:hypothetical protein
MDLVLFATEALFGIIFVAAARQWWARRDALSADVVLVFLPMTVVLALQVFRLVAGSIHRDPHDSLARRRSPTCSG